MEKGKTYLLFLYRVEEGLSADPCGNSGLVSQKKDVLEAVRALRKTSVRDQKPNKSPEPTADGAVRSAIAVHAASRRWLSFLR